MIETQNLTQWWEEVRKKYSPSSTSLQISDEAITIMVFQGNRNIILARYCKNTGKGVVLERRQKQIEVGIERRKS